jgi:hypothetical protein
MAETNDAEIRAEVFGILDDARRTGKNFGREYWHGSDLQAILQCYNINDLQTMERSYDLKIFDHYVEKAKKSCEMANADPKKHFATYSQTVSTSNGNITVSDWALSRLACYLIAKNSPQSRVSSLVENYFLGKNKTFEQFMEDKGRIILRRRLIDDHKILARADSRMGVDTRLEHALLGQETTRGFYEMDTPELQEYRNLGNENIYDHMGRTELASNDNVITDTADKLHTFRSSSGFSLAREIHRETAVFARRDFEVRHNTAPEFFPVAEKTPKQLEREEAKAIKELTKM